MGITGLIPFLEKSSRQVNISQYSGCTVAIDAYCWLHKGAFSCADKLARGDKTDAYVHYCMKYINMLLSHNIKPILVFDGRHLPAKAGTEHKRRENRENNRRRAAELLRQDKPNEARTFLQRCVDVTHTMAVELMRECRSRNIDCITAPYEADAQLAYLNIHNIAHIVITEDSDLLLFGCTKVVFKLDMNGNGLLVEQENLHVAMGLSKGCFTLDKFRHMCILSGCDYLPSLPKIGLVKACRFIKSTVDPDIHRALSRLGGHLNMSVTVPVEYRDRFVEADAMFRHQPVYDPLTRSLVPLTPLPPGAPPLPLLSEEPLGEEQLLHLALGNLDPFTLSRVDDWTPDKLQKSGGRANGWNGKQIAPHKSIWSSDFKPRVLVIEQPDPCKVTRTSTTGRVLERDVPKLPKRPLHTTEEELDAMRKQFGSSPQVSKKPRYSDGDILNLLEKTGETSPKTEHASEELCESPKKTLVNPFTKETVTSGNKFSGLSKLAQWRKTTSSPGTVVHSRYFGSEDSKQHSSEPDRKPLSGQSPAVKDSSNTSQQQATDQHYLKTSRTSIEKLSDSSISSAIQDVDKEMKKSEENIQTYVKGKENVNAENSISKRENTFNWKPSLKDMFGFRSKILTSTVRNKFVTPLKDEDSMSVKEQAACSGSTPLAEVENQSVRRNPFAKTAKVEQCLVELGSQGLSQDEDSELDVSPGHPASGEEPLSCTPKPQMRVGLSKKSSSSCQRSLLAMFAFTPKAKLQR